MTAANYLTLARLVAVPVFGALWIGGRLVPALWIFFGAAATDLLDGFVARYFGQQSRLGALLDPIADKCMLLVAWVVAAATGVAPSWVAAIVIGRDVLLGAGVVAVSIAAPGRHGPSEWRPTKLGKYAVFFQALTIALTILDAAARPPGLMPFLSPLMLMAAALTGMSFGQYVLRALRAVRRSNAPAGTRSQPQGETP